MLTDTVMRIIVFAVCGENQTAFLRDSLINAVLIKPVKCDGMVVGETRSTNASVEIAAHIKTILIPVNGHKADRRTSIAGGVIIRGAVIITNSLLALDPNAMNLAVVLKGIGGNAEEGARAGLRGTGIGVEVIMLAVDLAPASGGRAVQEVIPRTINLGQSSDLALADAVFIEAIVVLIAFILVAGELLNAGHGHVVHIVEHLVVVGIPALTDGLVQIELIREALEVALHKVGAAVQMRAVGRVVRAALAVVVFIQAKCLKLVRIKRTRREIDVIGEGSGVRDLQTAAAPRRVFLRGHLQTADDADRVGAGLVDGLGVVAVPVDEDLERVRRLVHLGPRKVEEILHDRHVAVIQLHVRIDVDIDLDLGEGADAVCQLQEDLPRGSALHITAGDQADQIG